MLVPYAVEKGQSSGLYDMGEFATVAVVADAALSISSILQIVPLAVVSIAGILWRLTAYPQLHGVPCSWLVMPKPLYVETYYYHQALVQRCAGLPAAS
jgi:hypothetical protein